MNHGRAGSRAVFVQFDDVDGDRAAVERVGDAISHVPADPPRDEGHAGFLGILQVRGERRAARRVGPEGAAASPRATTKSTAADATPSSAIAASASTCLMARAETTFSPSGPFWFLRAPRRGESASTRGASTASPEMNYGPDTLIRSRSALVGVDA